MTLSVRGGGAAGIGAAIGAAKTGALVCLVEKYGQRIDVTRVRRRLQPQTAIL